MTRSDIPVCVLKIGGSLQYSKQLRDWLRSLAEHSRGKCIIVPGGGGFADAVRVAQRESGIDDRSAHRMALLAMAQYGYALCGIEPRLVPAPSIAAIHAALAVQQVPLWLPLDLLDAQPGVEESWRMTSDSLAAWLAQRIGATQLVLVKAAPVAAEASIESLTQSGVVDELFAQYARSAGCAIRVIGQDAIESVLEILR